VPGGNCHRVSSPRLASDRATLRPVQHAHTRQAIGEEINPAIGTVEPIDANRCILEAGADDLWTMAVYIDTLGHDFTVSESPELVEHLKTLSERYARAANPA